MSLSIFEALSASACDAGSCPPDWYSPLAVFAVVIGVLLVLAGVAYAVVAAAGAMRRCRERKAVAQLIGCVDLPAPTPHRWFRIARSGGRHV